jgi:hypothetical protein
MRGPTQVGVEGSKPAVKGCPRLPSKKFLNSTKAGEAMESHESGSLAMEKAGDALEGLMEVGEGFQALMEVSEKVESDVLELADPAADLGERLTLLAQEMGEHFGERGAQLGELLQAGLEVVREGSAWLKEHPEVLSAAVRLVVFLSFGIEHPEALMMMIEKQPGAVEDIIRSFKPLIEAIQ